VTTVVPGIGRRRHREPARRARPPAPAREHLVVRRDLDPDGVLPLRRADPLDRVGRATVAGASAGIVLATLGAELFATEVRGTANAFLVGISVVGSAGGLIIAGQLSDRFGGIGRAIAVCGFASLIAALLVPALPESFGRELDDLSPSEGEPDRPSPPGSGETDDTGDSDPTALGEDGDG